MSLFATFFEALRRHHPYLHEPLRRLARPQDTEAIRQFVSSGSRAGSRKDIARQVQRISSRVPCAHSHEDLLQVLSFILDYQTGPEAVVVEAGTFMGGSAAKLSLACRATNRRLQIFDSFQGLPENSEQHGRNIFGREAIFRAGDYSASLALVRSNVERFGDVSVCDFRCGWFKDTLPELSSPVLAAYIDVDLVESTRTCIVNIFPKLVPGGRLFSQDGHLPLVIDLLNDRNFWHTEVGVEVPPMRGLGTKKLVTIEARP